MGNKLSKDLRDLHECGDAGRMVEGWAERAEGLERSEVELLATVERLRDAMDIIRQIANHPPQDKAILKKAIDALEATPPTNLNAVRREVAKEAILAAIEDYKREYCGQGIEALLSSFADIYPAKRYPDKE